MGMIHILIVTGVVVLVTGTGIIYMIRDSRRNKRDARKALARVDAHVRALCIINDPDLYDVSSSGGAELTLVDDADEAHPEAVDPLSATMPRHSVGVAAVVAVAVTASFIALIWLAVVPEPPTALKLPVPSPIASAPPAPPAPPESTVSPTERPSAQSPPTATIEPSPPVSRAAVTAPARSSSSARPTASASRSQPTSPTPATSEPSVPVSTCTVGVQSINGARFPCVIK